MENNVNQEVLDVTEVIHPEHRDNLNTGVAIAIGAGLALAVTATVGLVKKGIDAFKAKRAEMNTATQDETE